MIELEYKIPLLAHTNISKFLPRLEADTDGIEFSNAQCFDVLYKT